MQLLLDTHALVWWLAGDELLSQPAKTAIADEDNPIFVSAASVWEIATKHRLGKLPGVSVLLADFAAAIYSQGFVDLPISVGHAQAAGALPGPHRDPFDRMLIAQAMLENLTLVSNELVFDAYRRQADLVSAFFVSRDRRCVRIRRPRDLAADPDQAAAPKPRPGLLGFACNDGQCGHPRERGDPVLPPPRSTPGSGSPLARG